MKVEELEKMYQDLLKMDDTDDGIFDFKDALLLSDEEKILDFHFNILQDNIEEYLKTELFSFFSDRENTEAVDNYLYKKYIENKKNDTILSEVIQLLGHLRGKHAREVAIENINNINSEIRYKSIIVLGWVGDSNDLKILNKSLLSESKAELRGYCATAMRQIWYEQPSTRDDILRYLKYAIKNEDEEAALQGIIITAQDLLRKKLGIKETNYGDISGDVEKAKLNTIEALKLY